jgi:hypothetical protein
LNCYRGRTVLASGQGRNALEFLVDGLRQLERIGRRAQAKELNHLGAGELLAGPQPIERSLRPVIDALEPGADALLRSSFTDGWNRFIISRSS